MISNFGVAPRIKKVQEFGRPNAAASIHICVSKTTSSRLHPRSQVKRDWPTNCERICQVKVAPKGQEVQVCGRPRVAVSIHMCVAK